MARFARLLAVSAALLAVLAVGTAYTLQSHPAWQAYSGVFILRTNQALLLGSLLLLFAFIMKRFDERLSRRIKFAVRASAFVFFCITALFAISWALEINKKMKFATIPVESIYQFSFDGTSANAETWSAHLEEFEGKPDVHALEIGSFEGRSALWFLSHILTHPTSSITCVDVFPGPIEPVFDANIAASGMSRKIIKLKGESGVVLRKLGRKFDFVYIDGSHIAKDVFIDAALSWDLVKPGGLLIFDDYRFRRSSGDNPSTALIPQPAIDAFLTTFRHHIDVLHRDYQVIVRKKPEPDLGPENVLIRLKSLFL